jgi:hypothetical protein
MRSAADEKLMAARIEQDDDLIWVDRAIRPPQSFRVHRRVQRGHSSLTNQCPSLHGQRQNSKTAFSRKPIQESSAPLRHYILREAQSGFFAHRAGQVVSRRVPILRTSYVQ